MEEHYRNSGVVIEPLELARHYPFIQGNIIKYICRLDYKGQRLSDLLKIRSYLNKEFERYDFEDVVPAIPVRHIAQRFRNKFPFLRNYMRADGVITYSTSLALYELVLEAIANEAQGSC